MASLFPLFLAIVVSYGCGPTTAEVEDGSAADGVATAVDQDAGDGSTTAPDDAAAVEDAASPAGDPPAKTEPGDTDPSGKQPGDKEHSDKEPGDKEPGDKEPGDKEPAPGDPQSGDPQKKPDTQPGDPPTDLKPKDPNPAEQGPDAEPAAPRAPDGHPFPARFLAPNPEFFNAPDFPKDMKWMNTPGPLRKADLKGKFVILDFWTYCCINCMHILPELKKLEHAYPDELVVIGVHSAKFETEKETKNIEEAVLRYEIEHPVVNDSGHKIWELFRINSWPSLVVIDPEGYIVAINSGEVEFDALDGFLKRALPYYRENKLLNTKPLPMARLAQRQKTTPLRFPGKVLADEKGKRLFITDSNHNRIVVTSLDGKLLETIGTGGMGADDGAYDKATFDHPQGLALHGDTLYVADTENHLLRKVDLAKKTVATIAGIGEQWRGPWPGIDEFGRRVSDFQPPEKDDTGANDGDESGGGDDNSSDAKGDPQQAPEQQAPETPEADVPPEPVADAPEDKPDSEDAPSGKPAAGDKPAAGQPPAATSTEPRFADKPGITGLNSPWALLAHGDWLYIAMAGPHQIWRMKLDESEIGPYAGNGREDIVDGLKLPDMPYQRDRETASGAFEPVSAFAQPSGLTTDGKWLYVADSEGSSIRAVPLDIPANKGESVRTVVGTNKLPFGRLFEFGFLDGKRDAARLQHALGVAYKDGKIYTADTYNNAIRIVDAKTGDVQTLAGVRKEDDDGNGVGVPGNSDKDGSFDEPAGISVANGTLYIADTNNHSIRTIDLKTKKTGTLTIAGLTPPAPAPAPDKPSFKGAKEVELDLAEVAAVDGKIKFKAKLKLPIGWKMNKEITSTYYIESASFNGPIDRKTLAKMVEVAKGKNEFEFELPVNRHGADQVQISMVYYFCSIVSGECKTGSVVWKVPLIITSGAENDSVELKHRISSL